MCLSNLSKDDVEKKPFQAVLLQDLAPRKPTRLLNGINVVQQIRLVCRDDGFVGGTVDSTLGRNPSEILSDPNISPLCAYTLIH